MMYEYYDADKKAEAKSSIAAAENELNEKLEIYNDTDKTTNAETYDKQYKANSTKYINEVSSKYNLRPNEQKLLVARLADLSAGKHQEGRRKVSAKQDAIRGIYSRNSFRS
jgi:GTPase